ncbi:energy transducer TonB [Pontixanthobacter aquaemixtae]
MSNNRVIALILVALIHIVLGYALVTGLAYEAFQEAVERVTTVDVDEPEPEEPEDEPPPPEEVPETVPPPFVPPPQLNLPTERTPTPSPSEIPPRSDVSRTPNKTCPDGSVVAATAACGPATKRCPDGTVVPVANACPEPPPPPPKFQPKDPTPRGSPGNWASTRDYPSRALREEREGVTRFRVNVGANGRVTNCTVTGSSGHSDLDQETCKLVTRRGRFNPATNGDGNDVAGTWSSAVRWQIPQ